MRRSFNGALTCAVIAALAGCVVIPASEVKTSGEVSTPVALGEGRKIAILFSADYSPQTPQRVGNYMVECIRVAMRDVVPAVTLVSQEQFFAAVFPGLTPQQVLIRTDTIPILAARRDIRERIDQAAIDYLIMVGGQMERQSYIEALAPAPVVVGGWDKHAKLNATIFDLRHGGAVGSGRSEAKGSVFFVAPFLIPLGGGVDPDAPTCKALGAEVVRLLRGTPDDRR